MNASNDCNHNPYRQRAAGYLLVLGATMLLTVIGYASLLTARINTRLVTGTNDWSEAGALAIAGAELAPVLLVKDADWRKTYASGTPFIVAVNRKEITIILVDEDDGDFSTDPNKPIRAYAMACVGDAVRVRSVLLKPSTSLPLSCLAVSAHCVGDYVAYGGTLSSNQVVSTGANATGILSTLNANVEYMGSVSGVTISGTSTKVSTARTVPDPTTVFDYYVRSGTVIPLTALPVVDGDPTIDGAVLTPTLNPYGAETNKEGIYVIDCAGDVVDIRNSRIVGTLVLINAQSNEFTNHCQVRGQVSWTPAIPNYPAVLVQGILDFTFQGGVAMTETDLGVNLNPTGAPYLGEEDAALDDEYPSRIQGLVYASAGSVFLSNTPHIQGVLVSGSKMGTKGFPSGELRYDHRHYRDPPPGFGTGPYEPAAGTWRWDTPPCLATNKPCGTDADCCSGVCNPSGKCQD